MPSKLIMIVGVIIVIAIGAFLVLNSKSYSTPQPTSQTQTQSTSNSTSQASKQITVMATEFAFNPSTLSVKKGDTVAITFKNNGQFPHNLTIPDLSLATKTVSPGEVDTITFTFDKTGSFSFMCTIDSHADKGMKGTITVQ